MDFLKRLKSVVQGHGERIKNRKFLEAIYNNGAGRVEDVDAEFDKKYFREPTVGGDPNRSAGFRAAAGAGSVSSARWSLLTVAVAGMLGVLAVALVIAAVCVFLFVLSRRRVQPAK